MYGYYIVKFENEHEHVVDFPDTNMNEFFRNVSREICFGDCTDSEVTKIIFNGEHWYYGSESSMLEFVYTSDSGESWTGFFPEWKH